LGADTLIRNPAPPPKNEEAYALYLRSLAESYDPAPNKRALELLRRSVQLDPGYPPAWAVISVRSYADSRFGGGGPAMLQESDAAAERALALDPDFIDPAVELAINRTERGELTKAYRQAKTLLDRRPDSANAHHLLSYVLRYAGLLEEAGHQCDTAVLLDPEVLFGSCATTFMEAGNYRRAMDFIRKDYSSEWSKAHAIEIFVRDGRESQALQIGAPQVSGWDSYKMLLAFVQRKPLAEVSSFAANIKFDEDPEVNYLFAGHLAYCGRSGEALKMLRHAIQGHYCAYPVLNTDPLFASVRKDAKFDSVRSEAMACQQTFLDSIR
jgi:tetratricopeptide (TPR) repeat protein